MIAAYFELGPIRELIHQFKYQQISELSKLVGDLVALAAVRNNLSAHYVVPVPLHSARLSVRGFNQAELIAQRLTARCQVPLKLVLVRRRSTKSQTTLLKHERLANVADAFACQADLSNKTVVLVDDVMTTGATLEACTRALKLAGAKRVWGLVAARG